MLEVRRERLIRRQIEFAAYCRTQAARVRQDGERCRFRELSAAILRVALSYERMAAAADQLVRRYPSLAGSLEQQPSEPLAVEAA
jgi:hypothetical protein